MSSRGRDLHALLIRTRHQSRCQLVRSAGGSITWIWGMQEVTAVGFYSADDSMYGPPHVDRAIAETQLQAVRLALGRNLARTHVFERA